MRGEVFRFEEETEEEEKEEDKGEKEREDDASNRTLLSNAKEEKKIPNLWAQVRWLCDV